MNKTILAAIVGAVSGAAVTFFALKKKTDKVIAECNDVIEKAHTETKENGIHCSEKAAEAINSERDNNVERVINQLIDLYINCIDPKDRNAVTETVANYLDLVYDDKSMVTNKLAEFNVAVSTYLKYGPETNVPEVIEVLPNDVEHTVEADPPVSYNPADEIILVVDNYEFTTNPRYKDFEFRVLNYFPENETVVDDLDDIPWTSDEIAMYIGWENLSSFGTEEDEDSNVMHVININRRMAYEIYLQEGRWKNI